MAGASPAFAVLEAMTSSHANIRREIVHTRERMTETIDEIESEISERVTAAKRKLDMTRVVREHPWSALGVAVAIGALIGGTGADEKAAAATATAAKRAARASADGAKHVVQTVKASRKASASEQPRQAHAQHTDESPGWSDRLVAAASAPLTGVLDRVLDEMRLASRSLGARLAELGSGRRAATRRAVTDVVVIVETAPMSASASAAPVPSAEEVVPVPAEMLPTEVDARADAVESLGGGTHEPPLEPGAGDLGARWA